MSTSLPRSAVLAFPPLALALAVLVAVLAPAQLAWAGEGAPSSRAAGDDSVNGSVLNHGGARPQSESLIRGAVAVIRPPGPDRAGQEIVTRIVAELMADGVSVVALTCAVGDLACASLPGMRLSAIVLVQQRDNVRAIEVRTGKSSISFSAGGGGLVSASNGGRIHRLADIDSGAAPAALAIRTVELLRVMAMESGDAELELPAAPPPAAVVASKAVAGDAEVAVTKAFTRPTPPTGPRNLTVGVGAMMFAGFSNLPTAYGPTLSIGHPTSEHVLVSLVLAGPSFGADQQSGAGTASIRHEMGELQVDLEGLFWNSVVLRAGIGAGVYHVHVDGTTVQDVATGAGVITTTISGSGGGFSGLLSWSAAAVVNLRSDVGVFLQGRMFVLTPTPVIVLRGLEVGRTGNPGLAISSGVELRF